MARLSRRFHTLRVVNAHHAAAAMMATLRTVPTSRYRKRPRLPTTTCTSPPASSSSAARAATAHHLVVARPAPWLVIRSFSRP
jgi:hypothetical protein